MNFYILIQQKQSFRPLHGDLISQLCMEMSVNVDLKVVSVPFTGILFFNTEMLKLEGLKSKVSVPFPGILFLNFRQPCSLRAVRKNVSVPFPGILFLNGYLGYVSEEKSYSFRPLPGDLISQ